jgi:hypothetical protein
LLLRSVGVESPVRLIRAETYRENKGVTMKLFALLFALVCAGAAAGSLAAPVSADPGDITITMYNCTGPAGTPGTITIEKESPSGGALHIVGTKETFNRQGEFDLTLGVAIFGPPAGLASSGLMVTCESLNPFSGDLVLIYGKIAQTSP